MKSYRSTREVLGDIQHLLDANKPSFRHSPLNDVIELLSHGRHYSWVGIYLTAGEDAAQQLLGAGGEAGPGQVALPATRTKILVSMKLAGRELGVLTVESERENAFGVEDRVLLENVADALVRFLSGPGKYLVRRARGPIASSRGLPREGMGPGKSAAAGEK